LDKIQNERTKPDMSPELAVSYAIVIMALT